MLRNLQSTLSVTNEKIFQVAVPMLDVQFGQASDFGKVRTNNEDAMGSYVPPTRRQGRSHGFLFAVADGVGGMDLGEVASATAIKTLTEAFAKAIDQCAKEVVEAAQANGYDVVIIADHGNADFALNEDGSENTAHSLNPVPFIWVTNQQNVKALNG